MKYRIFILIAIATTFACKRINPDKHSHQKQPSILPQPLSSVNIPLEIPLVYLEKQLNQGFRDLVYSETALDISSGVTTDVEVHRTGEIRLSAGGENQLLVKFPLRLKGELNVEKKIFGQILQTSIPYDELLSPEVSFTPEVGKNWDLAISNLKIITWGRSLKYSFLGYEVDFDPIIRKHIENVLRNQLGPSGPSRISFRHLADETWKSYSQPFKIGSGDLEAYIYTVPRRIKINERLTAGNSLKLNIGLQGEVMTYTDETHQVDPSPLPGLYYNEDTVNHLDITLPLAILYQTLDNYLNSELSGKTFKIDDQSFITPQAISTQSYGDRALVKMDFTLERTGKKNLTGELYLVGKPTYDEKNEAIVFKDIDFDINTKNILTNSARWLKQRKLLETISRYAIFPISDYIDETRVELQKRGYFATDFASLRVKSPALQVTGIYATEDDVRIYLNVKGKLEVKLINPEHLLK